MLPGPKTGTSTGPDVFEDDDEGWEEMPVIRDDFANGLDEEDKKKYHYVTPEKQGTVNATGNLIDFDNSGHEWREKVITNEAEYSEYTRLRLNEEDDNDELHLRTKFLFDEDKAMTPLSQMQATKNMLTEAQRIAYVGLCALVAKEMAMSFKLAKSKELKPAIESLELWHLKIMGRLYYHMELETQEQKMIESLAEHGVQAADLAPSLMTTHTVANPEYDPTEASKQEIVKQEAEEERIRTEEHQAEDITDPNHFPTVLPNTPTTPSTPYQTTANVLPPSASDVLPGVSTSLSSADKNVTLDIRWTVLCDLFLLVIADSVYDARSRVLLEAIAFKLGLGWLDVVKFEERVTEALEIQEGVEKLEQKEVMEGRVKAAKKRRYAMLGLATLGGGLVIGLSAGLLAPVIGAGLGAAFTTIGVSGTSAFLAGTGGAAVITTAGTLTGSGIAIRGMARRTQDVRTFDLLPLHNSKRVNCILTVSGFMTSSKDDVRLPFSVLDPIVGDVFSVLWEPEMLGEAGSTLKILTSEVLSQVSTTVLQATVMTALMSALQWPILLTKLGYLIDNPWSNALDRARAAGLVLADVLIQRHLGVRPITLIGFSLGARVIFYCLLELAKKKAFGIVQDVFILGATLTASKQNWLQARSVVSGRFVNGFARNDWVLNYLFRATSGGLQNIAGLRPVLGIPGLENVDVTDKIAGHMSYRTFMPLILDQLGFPVSSDYFDEPVALHPGAVFSRSRVKKFKGDFYCPSLSFFHLRFDEPDMKEDRIVVRDGEERPKKKSWFTRRGSGKDAKKKPSHPSSRPPSGLNKTFTSSNVKAKDAIEDDELPERLDHTSTPGLSSSTSSPVQSPPGTPRTSDVSASGIPVHAGFDLKAIQEVIASADGAEADVDASVLNTPVRQTLRTLDTPLPQPYVPSSRTESAPPPVPTKGGWEGARAERSPTSVSGARPRHVRSRNMSTPFPGSTSGVEEDEEGDIASAGPSGSGSGSGSRGLSSAFARSVALGDPLNDLDDSPFSGPTRSSYWNSEDTGTYGIGGSGNRPTGFGGMSDRVDGWFSGGFASGANAGTIGTGPVDPTPALSFGGAGGSMWDSGAGGGGLGSFGLRPSSAVTSSPEIATSSSRAFSVSPPPPALPPDILNPFAMSATDISAGPGGRGGDGWSPPPLTTKNRPKQAASTLNVNANPWG
ncbi:DUF726-domain-containing protein [Phellopilus nigrolimitatus]|nr:DUF726-domain-containing protein [Phellopilus nigrolimitatus]